jgi:hypothetical protein
MRRWSISLLACLVVGVGLASADTPPRVPKDLLEKRLDTARKVYEQNLARVKNGQGQPSGLAEWSERWLDAELALAAAQADRAKALRTHLDRAREVERIATNFARAGQGRQADADAATYFRLQAEIRLAKEGEAPHSAAEGKDAPGKD